jgi:hypothetical protein
VRSRGPKSIGIDFDNTLVDYGPVFRAHASELGFEGAGLGKTEIRDRLRARGEAGEIAWQRLQARVYGKGLGEAAIMDGAAEFLAACRLAGVAVTVVSHKSRYAAQDPGGINLRLAARAWLDRHCAGIAVGDAYFEDDRACKLTRIGHLGCTHFIDDLLEVLTEETFPPGVTRLWLTEDGAICPSGVAAAGSWRHLKRIVFGA